MNILYVMHSMKVGGIEKLLITISNELVRENNICLCIISNEYSQELLSRLDNRVKIIYLRRKKLFRRLSYISQLERVIKQNNIDVIHIQQPEMMLYYAPMLLLSWNTKKVVTIHDTGKIQKIGTINRFLVKFLFDDVVAISEGVKKEILAYNFPEHKIHRIYNAIDLNEFQLRDHHKSKGGPLVVGNVARVMPSKKGQDILIKAVALLTKENIDVNCKFAGAEVERGAIAHMYELAESLGIKDKITFLGNVDDIAAFLMSIDLFVLPSRYEGFGISLIEAMATGLPCISSDVPGVNEIIVDKSYGEQFKCGDEVDLTGKMKYVIEHIDTYNASQIRDFIAHNFSIEHMCDCMMKVYSGEIKNE